jgi:hypothetical protein
MKIALRALTDVCRRIGAAWKDRFSAHGRVAAKGRMLALFAPCGTSARPVVCRRAAIVRELPAILAQPDVPLFP